MNTFSLWSLIFSSSVFLLLYRKATSIFFGFVSRIRLCYANKVHVLKKKWYVPGLSSWLLNSQSAKVDIHKCVVYTFNLLTFIIFFVSVNKA